MKHWYALRSKPRSEFSAAMQLSRADIEAYVPQVSVPQPLGRAPAPRPFFPGYLFGQLDPDLGEIHVARYTPGVADIVGYGGEPWPVPDELITAIQERLARSHGKQLQCEFHPGDRVIVTAGPLRDMEAIFDAQLSAAGRVRVFVKLLRRLCPAEIHVGQLRLSRKAAGYPRAH